VLHMEMNTNRPEEVTEMETAALPEFNRLMRGLFGHRTGRSGYNGKTHYARGGEGSSPVCGYRVGTQRTELSWIDERPVDCKNCLRAVEEG